MSQEPDTNTLYRTFGIFFSRRSFAPTGLKDEFPLCHFRCKAAFARLIRRVIGHSPRCEASPPPVTSRRTAPGAVQDRHDSLGEP